MANHQIKTLGEENIPDMQSIGDYDRRFSEAQAHAGAKGGRTRATRRRNQAASKNKRTDRK